MATHLSDDDIDRDRLRALREALLPGTTADGLDDHLTYEQLAALVDDQADDVAREIADVHLAVCPECAAELRGLEELRPAAGRWPKVRWASLAAAALIVAGTTAVAWRFWPATPNQTDTPVVSNTPAPTPSTAAVITLTDAGGQVSLDANGRISGLGEIDSTPIGQAVKSALTTRQLSIAKATAGLRSPQGTLMGSGEGVPFALASPVGMNVRTDRPTLRWQPLAGAGGYVVAVFDTKYKRIARSSSLRAPEWTVEPALPRGMIYVWQVTAIRDGVEIKSPQSPAPEARFRVIGAAEEAAISRAEQTHASSHLVRGVIYAAAGLLAEAEREFRLLVDANPSSDVASALLRDVTSKAGAGK